MSASVSDVAYDGLDLDAGPLLRELNLMPYISPKQAAQGAKARNPNCRRAATNIAKTWPSTELNHKSITPHRSECNSEQKSES